MAENLITRPTLTGVMRESLAYTNMGIGLTDRLFLLGHADNLPLNDTHQVVSMKETVKALGSDPDAPLLRGLLEAYYSGARDIWVIPVARMSDYVADLDERLAGDFYQIYFDQLAESYELLKGFELPQVIVPLNAPLYGGDPDVDFVTQLANHCNEAYLLTGAIRIGVIGTAIKAMNQEVIDEMTTDARWDSYGLEGKFVLPVVGSGLFNIQETVITHEGSPVASVAAGITKSPLNRGMANQRLDQVISTNFPDFTKHQLEDICNSKLNPVVRSTRSKRGLAFDVRLLTDNMLATDGSDYWSLGQVRLVQQVIENLRRLGRRHLGSVGFASFKRDVEEFFLELTTAGVIRNFGLSIERKRDYESVTQMYENGEETSVTPYAFTERVVVDVWVQPYLGVRTLAFQAEIGPGA